jgi:hypothetical protein
VALLSLSGGSLSGDPCDARCCSRSAMEAAGDASFHGRRWYWWYRQGRRLLLVHAEVKAAATAVIPVAGQRDGRFLVAEQQTQEMGHLRLPDEASHFRGQPRSGERPSYRQQSCFCEEHAAQTCGCERSAAPHPSVPGLVSESVWTGYRSAREVRDRDPRCSRMTQLPRLRSARVSLWVLRRSPARLLLRPGSHRPLSEEDQWAAAGPHRHPSRRAPHPPRAALGSPAG